MLRLNDICTIISRGVSLPTKNKSKDGNYYLIRLLDIEENGEILLNDESRYQIDNEKNLLYNYSVKSGDLIIPEMTRTFPTIRTIRNVDEKEKILYSLKVIFIRVNNHIYNPEFLKKVLNNPKYNQELFKTTYNELKKVVNRKMISLGLSQIVLDNLRNFEIPDISLEEQDKILKKEFKINEKIRGLEKELHELYNI